MLLNNMSPIGIFLESSNIFSALLYIFSLDPPEIVIALSAAKAKPRRFNKAISAVIFPPAFRGGLASDLFSLLGRQRIRPRPAALKAPQPSQL
jgi:hypothetical protein